MTFLWWKLARNPLLQKRIGHSLKNLGPSQKALRPRGNSSEVTSLGESCIMKYYRDKDHGIILTQIGAVVSEM